MVHFSFRVCHEVFRMFEGVLVTFQWFKDFRECFRDFQWGFRGVSEAIHWGFRDVLRCLIGDSGRLEGFERRLDGFTEV